MMKAEIISTGTELLLGKTLNTSAFYLTGYLSEMGIEVDYHTTIGDNRGRLFAAVRQALNRSELVILTGGLGPTADDLTKGIIAELFGLEMRCDGESMEELKAFYRHKSDWPSNTEKQAFFPEGAKVLPNHYGTAPGAILVKDQKYCVILPGPPSEMKPMLERYVLPELERLLDRGEKLTVKVLKIFGLSESDLEKEVADLMKQSSPFLTLLDQHTYMDLRITVRSRDQNQAEELISRTENIIRQRLGNKVFGVDEETHSQVVGKLLREKKLTLATAESCTAGLLSGRIADTAGSSDYFLGGIVSYANSAKEELLGVKKLSLESEGAVSEKVAAEMAQGARKALGADLGLATTGIAGPGGGTAEKPVGLVYVGLAHPQGTIVQKLQLAGNRDSIRNMTVEAALNMLRLYLLEKK